MDGLLDGRDDRAAEAEADDLAAAVTRGQATQRAAPSPTVATGGARPPSSTAVFLGEGHPLPTALRAAAEARLGRDLSDVQVHTDHRAQAAAEALDARAFTIGSHVAFGAGEFVPGSAAGRGLIAHELAHIAQQGATGSVTVQRKTKGEETSDRAQALLTEHDKIKVEADVLRAALQEIKSGAKVGFNKAAGLQRTATAARLRGLDPARTATLSAEWTWLADHAKDKATAPYKQREQAFFAALESRLTDLRQQHPGGQTHDRLRYTSAGIADLIIQVADADVSAELLYTFAYNEGMADYVQAELGLPRGTPPTAAQLATVRTDQPIDSFQYLGLDVFMTDLKERRKPLADFLPSGFDQTKLTPLPARNEKQTDVVSARFPDMKMALQGLLAMIKRRRALFVEDAKALRYAAAVGDELVFWTYVYYNPGPGEGKRSLTAHKSDRKLGDWIRLGDYPDAQKVLKSFRMLRDMKLFP